MGLLSFKKPKDNDKDKRDDRDAKVSKSTRGKYEKYPHLPSYYEVLDKLGEGAFSSVYKCYNHNDDNYYAIKIIDKTNLNNKQLNNIQNEINIMQNLHHDNVLKLIDFFNAPNYCYLILEYCNGGEIFNKIIEFTYFSENLSRHIFMQLLHAIQYLHDNNIVHRDIKPENLFFQKIPVIPNSLHTFSMNLRKSDDCNKLDEGVFQPYIGGGGIGKIKLGDFGLAKKLINPKLSNVNNNLTMNNLHSSQHHQQHHHNSLKTPCGTAGYTAPEVITVNQDLDKQNYYSKSVDIWSLGCFLYTILCGFPPFYDDDQNKLTMKILNGNYSFLQPWWDEISLEAKDLISKMLVINPNHRITIDEIFNHPWVKQEKITDGYFNVNSRYENKHHSIINDNEQDELHHQPTFKDDDQPPEYDGLVPPDLHLKLKSPEDPEHTHIENIDVDSLDSDDPISDQPSPFYSYQRGSSTTPLKSDKQVEVSSEPQSNGSNSTFNQLTQDEEFRSFKQGLNNLHNLNKPTNPINSFNNTGILSPRANAIKSVFNNPAMTDLSSLKFSHSNIFNQFSIDEQKRDIMTNLNKLSLKSSNESSDDDQFDRDDIDTRQSSIVSNDKFHLNMNDSNIILRRKSTLRREG